MSVVSDSESKRREEEKERSCDNVLFGLPIVADHNKIVITTSSWRFDFRRSPSRPCTVWLTHERGLPLEVTV